MKQLFSLLAFCIFFGYTAKAQPGTAAPNPPARNATDVISLFSDAYTNISGTDWFPNWGQGTVVTDVLAGTNPTKKYDMLDYQGVQLSSSINASSMSNLHVDIWTSNCDAFEFYLIKTAGGTIEEKVTLRPTFNGWNSYDINLSLYNPAIVSNIDQFKFVDSGFVYRASTTVVYLDNIYFWKSANTPTITGFSIPAKLMGDAPFTLTAPTSNSAGAFTYSSGNQSVATISGNTVTVVGVGTSIITANQAAAGSYSSGSTTATLVVSFPPPTTAAPTPTRPSSSVLSLFSDAYTDVAGTDWFPNWGQSTAVSDVNIAGNATKKYDYLNYQGVQFASPIDASNMTNLHLDLWTPNCTAFDVFLINAGGVEQSVTLTPTLSGWNSYDILLSQYTTVNKSAIIQFKLTGLPWGTSTVYLDNLYFWKPANAPTITGFSVPAKVVGVAPFALTAPTSNSSGAFTYNSSNTTVATISGNTVTVLAAGTSTITATQAAAGAYGSASVNATLVVSFAPPTNAAPSPPRRNALDVISLFSNAYTDVAGTDWYPNWGQSTTVTDVNIVGNATKKYEFLNYQGVQFASPIDASGMSHLHVDIWTPNCSAFEVFLINTGGAPVEQAVTLNPTLSGWNSYNIQLSQYNTVNLSNIGQIKLVGTPFGSSTVYLDNFYFYKQTNAPVIKVTQPTCSTSTGRIRVLSAISGFSFSIDGTNYSNTTGEFTGVPTGTYNVTSRNNTTLVVSSPAIAVIDAQPIGSLPPSAITGTRNIKNCDTLQTYSVTAVPGYTYRWTVTGASSGNAIISGQGTNSVVILMKADGTVSVKALNACGTPSTTKALVVIKVAPSTPGPIQQSFVPNVLASTNVCLFKQNVVSVTGIPATFRIRKAANATGYYWQVPGGSVVNYVNDTTITVIFPDTITVTNSKPKYIRVFSLSECDTSDAASSIKLTLTQVATPGIVMKNFGSNIPAVTNVCALIGGGTEVYRIRKVANASYYNWSLSRGTNATITRLNASGVNDTAIMVTFGAGFTRDTIRVTAVNGCNTSIAQKVFLSAVLPPATPNSLISNTGSFNGCVGGFITFTVASPAPSASQEPTNRYRWAIPSKTLIRSAQPDSSSMTIKFLSGYVGGNITVRGVSACNVQGAILTQALTHIGCAVGSRPTDGNLSKDAIVVEEGTNDTKLYPNPNNGTFTVQMQTGKNDRMPATIQIIDVYGRVVSQFIAANNAGRINRTVSESKLPNGIYTVKYTVGLTTSTSKMVIQK